MLPSNDLHTRGGGEGRGEGRGGEGRGGEGGEGRGGEEEGRGETQNLERAQQNAFLSLKS